MESSTETDTLMITKGQKESYRVDIKEFGSILEELVTVFNSVVDLSVALAKAPKGSYLTFPDPDNPGSVIPFNKKHVASAKAKFAKTIMLLKNYFRVSKKKTRKPVPPESFSGTYTPVYAGDALVNFFGSAVKGFGYMNPSTKSGGLLMDNLEMVKRGYLLRNTSTMLFYIYAHSNGLQDADNAQFASSDSVMMKAFGGDIPAAFYTTKSADGKSIKVNMSQAIADGNAPAQGLNTYDTMKLSHPNFDPKKFNTYFYQNIAASNYFSKGALSAEAEVNEEFSPILDALYSEEVKAQMLKEHELVKSVSDQWHAILEPERKDKRDARKKIGKKSE